MYSLIGVDNLISSCLICGVMLLLSFSFHLCCPLLFWFGNLLFADAEPCWSPKNDPRVEPEAGGRLPETGQIAAEAKIGGTWAQDRKSVV